MGAINWENQPGFKITDSAGEVWTRVDTQSGFGVETSFDSLTGKPVSKCTDISNCGSGRACIDGVCQETGNIPLPCDNEEQGEGSKCSGSSVTMCLRNESGCTKQVTRTISGGSCNEEPPPFQPPPPGDDGDECDGWCDSWYNTFGSHYSPDCEEKTCGKCTECGILTSKCEPPFGGADLPCDCPGSSPDDGDFWGCANCVGGSWVDGACGTAPPGEPPAPPNCEPNCWLQNWICPVWTIPLEYGEYTMEDCEPVYKCDDLPPECEQCDCECNDECPECQTCDSVSGKCIPIPDCDKKCEPDQDDWFVTIQGRFKQYSPNACPVPLDNLGTTIYDNTYAVSGPGPCWLETIPYECSFRYVVKCGSCGDEGDVKFTFPLFGSVAQAVSVTVHKGSGEDPAVPGGGPNQPGD